MKRIWNYLFLFVIASGAKQSPCIAQNLVSNPSFELYENCPDYFSQINRTTGWWSARPTADYFNTCAPFFPHPIVCVNVPANSFGYQTAASGNAYVGVISKEATSEHRETIGSQLITPLQIGIRYYVSFKVSFGEEINPLQWCAINKLGALFSTVRYDSLSPSPICNNCAQICSDSIITDTLNWIRIKGSFIADSNYSYINIGRFNANSLTDSIQIAGTDCYAYYYIDDVCVSNDSLYAYNYVYTNSIDVEPKRAIKIYPNPTNDFVTIEGEENDLQSLKLYDAYGRLLEAKYLNMAAHYILNFEKLPSGLYLLNVLTKNLKSTDQIIIKR